MWGMVIGIGVGGATGAICRYIVMTMAFRWWGGSFPFGTVIVNVAGCFLMGLATEIFSHVWPERAAWRALITTGFLGGFTTFSAFAWDAYILLEREMYMNALFYMTLSVMLSLTGFAAAVWLTRQFL